VALTEGWYSQLSSTLTPSAGGGGEGSPSSPGKKIFEIYEIFHLHAVMVIYSMCVWLWYASNAHCRSHRSQRFTDLGPMQPAGWGVSIKTK